MSRRARASDPTRPRASSPSRALRGALLALCAWQAGCAGAPPGDLATADRRVRLCPDPAAPADTVVLQYLGVGGVLLRHDGAALMTAPFYSHPSLLRVGLGLRLRPDRARILRRLPRVDDVRAILVGHAHYDHLMDVPVVLRERTPAAVVYGNDTTRHQLAALVPELPEDRRVGLNAHMGSWRAPGPWLRVEGAPFRILALESDHSPHWNGIELYSGRLERDAREPPEDAGDWVGGQTLAYLVDVLRDDGSVLLRLHYQDAASRAPRGFPPPGVLEERAVDVAVLCVGAYHTVDDYPDAVLRTLAPRHALLAHWEDFFVSPDDGPRRLRATDLEGFVRRTTDALPEGAGWTLPAPGVSLHLEVCR